MSTRPKFLLQHILQYKVSGGEVGEPTFQKLCKHSWYLTEKNVVFALFSCRTAMKQSKQMKCNKTKKSKVLKHEKQCKQ